jgi:aldose 1-epimerase
MKKMAIRHFFFPACYICPLLFIACQPNPNQTDASSKNAQPVEATIVKAPFGTAPGGSSVDIYTLTNASGMEARITNYGGILVSLKVPDRNGKLEDVTLGYDSLSQYIADNPYFGALIGRYGNRIGKARITLDGMEYKLAANNGPNHLHGGLKGFDKVVWLAEPLTVKSVDSPTGHGGVGLRLRYHSPGMEEGYPGNLDVQVIYTLTDAGEFCIYYAAKTDATTIVNLTHHSYFNLTGGMKGDVLGHELQIRADSFIPVDETLIPTGEVRPLDGSPLDFRAAKAIGRDIEATGEQLQFGQGYDHCWVLNRPKPGENLSLAAKVYEPVSGRVMEVLTTEPGLQFYSGNFLDGVYTGKGGKVYNDRAGFCLETEHYPDSPNQPGFPSVVLKPGDTYRTTTVYRFGVK